MPFDICSYPTTGYGKRFGDPIRHVFGKYNVAWVVFIWIVVFLYLVEIWAFQWITLSSGFFRFLVVFKYLIIPFWSKITFYNVTNVVWCWWICWEDDQFVTYFLGVSYLIEDGCIFLEVFPQDNIFHARCD